MFIEVKTSSICFKCLPAVKNLRMYLALILKDHEWFKLFFYYLDAILVPVISGWQYATLFDPVACISNQLFIRLLVDGINEQLNNRLVLLFEWTKCVRITNGLVIGDHSILEPVLEHTSQCFIQKLNGILNFLMVKGHTTIVQQVKIPNFKFRVLYFFPTFDVLSMPIQIYKKWI